jgi:hypothetical protein
MCRQQVYTKTDVCIMDINSELLLLVQEDKSHINLADPAPQLVAEAIAAFQANNLNRVNNLLVDPLPKQVFPGITMVGTFPRFYKIEVTTDLDMCIRGGTYPTTTTTVERHTPRVPRRHSDGMRPLDNRIHVLRCYEGFKQFVLQESSQIVHYFEHFVPIIDFWMLQMMPMINVDAQRFDY